MATLYKHGELGQIERVSYKLAYCADGKILRNQGDGWKLYRTVKPGIDPREHFEKCKANYEQKLRECPAFAAWRSLFHRTFSFSRRYLALSVISSMPQDPDGVWSELNDYAFGSSNGEYGIDEIVQVCRAYQAAEAESKAKQPAPTPATVPA